MLATVVACGSSTSTGSGGTGGAGGSTQTGGASGSATGGSAGTANASAGAAQAGSGGVVGTAGTSATGGNGGDAGEGAGGEAGAQSASCTPATFALDCPPAPCMLVSGCTQNVCQYTAVTTCETRSARGTFSAGIADLAVGDLSLHGNLGAFRADFGAVCVGTTCVTGGVSP